MPENITATKIQKHIEVVDNQEREFIKKWRKEVLDASWHLVVKKWNKILKKHGIV